MRPPSLRTARTSWELQRNFREILRLTLEEFQGARFGNRRVQVRQDSRDPVPTRKGVTIPPRLWPEFRQVLAEVEEAMLEAGWLNREDLESDAL